MRIIVKKDYEEMSRFAALEFLSYMRKPGRVNIAPTAGTTPARMYELIHEFIQGDTTIFDNDLYFYQQDNFLSTKHPEVISYFKEIDTMFFEPNNVKEAQIKRLTFATYENADESIAADGGLDLVLMGLGGDGHIAANMPGTPFSNKGYVQTFEGEFQQQMAEMFGAPDGDTWTSLGMSTLMKARNILLIVSGKGKAEILRDALYGPVTEQVQASILRMHPNLTIVCDEEAAALLEK